mmetsp:Transcript_5165/g.16612  ORF Transcript_5165/g.16612 Transcript_5165/m.16612 type:complete len:268 (+) Transcript_5165:341-1144(+)
MASRCLRSARWATGQVYRRTLARGIRMRWTKFTLVCLLRSCTRQTRTMVRTLALGGRVRLPRTVAGRSLASTTRLSLASVVFRVTYRRVLPSSSLTPQSAPTRPTRASTTLSVLGETAHASWAVTRTNCLPRPRRCARAASCRKRRASTTRTRRNLGRCPRWLCRQHCPTCRTSRTSRGRQTRRAASRRRRRSGETGEAPSLSTVKQSTAVAAVATEPAAAATTRRHRHLPTQTAACHHRHRRLPLPTVAHRHLRHRHRHHLLLPPQ